MAFSLKLKKRSGFLPLFLIRVFSLQVDLSQLILIKKQGSTHGNFIKILKFFGGFLPFFQISGVSDWALDQSHQESGKIYPIFMYTKWLQSITVIISEELCFVSHQYWSYHIVSLLPDHYRKSPSNNTPSFTLYEWAILDLKNINTWGYLKKDLRYLLQQTY